MTFPRKRRAAALLNVLMLGVLAFGLLVVPMANWVFQSNIDRAATAKDGARRLAEAAAHLAVARLIKDPSLNGGTLPSLNITLPSYPDGRGLVALDSQKASDFQIPWSVNNLAGSGPIPGRDGVAVPQEKACIVAVGRYLGREARVEVVLNVPAFPYVVGSSVPVTAVDGLKVFGIRSPAALASGYSAIPDSEKVPGHISTNAADPGPSQKALQLKGSGTSIEGDAQAKGGISVSNGAVVKGELRPGAQSAPLPKVDLNTLDTISRPGCNAISAASLSGAQLSGFNRRAGDLSLVGGLDLQGGVLYVDGNLTIQGGIKGKGAVIATGTVNVQGGSSLTGDSQTAVVAGGSVSLQGVQGQPSEYRGLVYTEGNLDCRFTNIAGTVVVNNSNPSGSTYLEQVSMAESSALSTLSMQVTSTVNSPGTPRDPRLQSPPGMRVYANSSATAGLTGPTLPAPDGTNQEIKPEFVWYPKQGDGSDMAIPPGFVVTHPNTTPNEPWIEIAPVNPLPADKVALGGVRQINLNPNDPVTGTTNFNLRTVYIQGTNQEFATEADLRAGMAQAIATWFPSCTDASARVDSYINDLNNQMPAYMQAVADAYNFNSKLIATSPQNSVSLGTAASSTSVTTPWKLDLGDFYNLADRIRILSWKEI